MMVKAEVSDSPGLFNLADTATSVCTRVGPAVKTSWRVTGTEPGPCSVVRMNGQGLGPEFNIVNRCLLNAV